MRARVKPALAEVKERRVPNEDAGRPEWGVDTGTGGCLGCIGFQHPLNMLIRISLIIAIVAGLAVGVINFVQVKEVIATTRQERDFNKTEWDKEVAAHGKTKRELSVTKTELAATTEKLKSTEEARDTALADAEKNRRQAADLTAKLKTMTADRDDARAELAAWAALGLKVDQVRGVITKLKETEDALTASTLEKRILQNEVNKLNNRLAQFIDPEYRVKLPANLRAQVVVSDPKWDFVVLNAGENQGMLERGEMLVNRDGKLVAKVRIVRVEGDRSIANVLEGWKIAEVFEGDLAIPAF